uniref:Uncharacterized protein n=1 Tax=Timema douglasi TaxID=61478 RepID=A0A7R8ZJ66_TIMDO|nr:unnamed protein product [Timema douglasi]
MADRDERSTEDKRMDGSKTGPGPRIEDYLEQSGIDYEEATKAAINIQVRYRLRP